MTWIRETTIISNQGICSALPLVGAVSLTRIDHRRSYVIIPSSRQPAQLSATPFVAGGEYHKAMVIHWSGSVSQINSDTSRTREVGRNLAKDIKRCSLEILRRRELIESLPTLIPLSIAATPLFELVLEVACQISHNRLPSANMSTRGSWISADERWSEAINKLSRVCLNLPERRCVDFLDFWFEQEGAGQSSTDTSIDPDELIRPTGENGGCYPSQRLSDYLLGDSRDTSFDAEIDLSDEELDEPADVGGDMNITLEFVHTTNRVFDDTETLAARLAAQLQAAGRELLDLLSRVERHATLSLAAERL